ncbi:IS1634 family transposase [Mycoplasmopsis anatis]|nr:IS1634 family transposase [Mycoplasmopsis anatis]VEU74039.1 Transposase [Mycoplasmopsis anatis]
MKKTNKRNWIISRSKRNKGTYISIGYRRLDSSGYETRFGIGYEEEFDSFQPNSVKIIQEIIRDIPLSWTKEKIIEIIDKKIKQKNVKKSEVYEKYKGIELIKNMVDYFNIFENCTDTKSISLNTIVVQQIYQKITNPISVFATYKESLKHNKDSFKKNSFYRSLDYIALNQEQILKNVNNKIVETYKRDISIVWYDSTTSYFETFDRKGFKKPGFSKDGKFKEDQIVIGLVTDSNGIPLHYKVFLGNTADSKTFIPFVLELLKTYEIKNVTIIADKGMSVNKNIRFLEDKKLNYIISYRLKSSSKAFKEYVINEDGYKKENGMLFKSREIVSTYKNGRNNGNYRKQIITFSSKRALKDRKDREQLIDNFNKIANEKGQVLFENMTANKKYRFFKAIENKAYYILDIEKIEEDQKYDGYYIYETNRFDLKESDIVSLYSKQWQAEENFRVLKGNLSLRPMYLSTWNHIKGYICLSFLSLVMIKFLVYQINKFTGLSGDDKFTVEKIISIMRDVKETEKYFDGKLIETLEIKNNITEQSWEDFNLIKFAFNEITK